MITGFNLNLKGADFSLAKRHLVKGGAVQRYIDSEVIRLMAPYTPFRMGILEGSATRTTNIGSGHVSNQTPYAKRLYYNPQYHFSGAPMRGGMWFERMKADHKDSILRGAAKLSGGRL